MSRLHRDYLEEKVSLASEKSILLQVRAFEQKRVSLYKYNLFIIIAPPLGLPDFNSLHRDPIGHNKTRSAAADRVLLCPPFPRKMQL